MLLNRVLTVRPGEAASHRGRGWEEVTERAIHALAARGGPLRRDPLGPRRPVAQADARAGPVGGVARTPRRSRPAAASSAPARSAGSNRLLEEQGGEPVDWDAAAWE